jgi:hypothetical protein
MVEKWGGFIFNVGHRGAENISMDDEIRIDYIATYIATCIGKNAKLIIVSYIIPGPTQLKRIVRALNRGLINPQNLKWPAFGGKHGGESRVDIFSYSFNKGII